MVLKPSFQLLNDKIRVLNQSGSKQLILSAQEARNLHHDIFELLNQPQTTYNNINESKQLEMDGGNF